MKTESGKARKRESGFELAFRKYVRASRAYQRDCNLRLGVKATDVKRRHLKRANDLTFKGLLKAGRTALLRRAPHSAIRNPQSAFKS